MVHLACHGIQDLTEPHRSHFSLTNGDLTVARLMETDLKHAFFAFLSACETARGDPKHADEVVHLASTMLFAGLKSIVATMWWVNHRWGVVQGLTLERAMSDRDGPYVAKLFYEKLFEEETINIDAIPSALDYAVTALRNSGASPERWATFVHMGAWRILGCCWAIILHVIAPGSTHADVAAMVAYALVRQGTGIDATTVGVNSSLPKVRVADIYPTYASVEEINGARRS
jgi:hypothetical protein